jgi:hypothetical protein
MTTTYKISIDADTGRDISEIQKEIVGLLDENKVHKTISDICREKDFAKCDVTIEIYIPPREIPRR